MKHEELLNAHPELAKPEIQLLLSDICAHMRRAAPAIPNAEAHLLPLFAGQTQGWLMFAERLNIIHVPPKKVEPQQTGPKYPNPNPQPRPDGNPQS